MVGPSKNLNDVLAEMAAFLCEDVTRAFISKFKMTGLSDPSVSPIQQFLGAAFHYLLESPDEYGRCSTGINFSDLRVPTLDDLTSGRVAYDNIGIFPEFPIKQFRADFLVYYPNYGGVLLAAVECDGHDFHERTKAQARHDRARDRLFQSLGLLVLRFTGSEIYADPLACAESVFETLETVSYDRFLKGKE